MKDTSERRCIADVTKKCVHGWTESAVVI